MQNNRFVIESTMRPTGDQPQAIEALTKGFLDQKNAQTLLGVTGSGKTFSMAHVIERLQKPTLVIAHNKTLAAQLCAEFKSFFPQNAVEFFVSYYDYYQPEAYIAATDTYIEKDSSINEEIDRMRHSATSSLLERNDVIVVASVSCIYGLGDPDDYKHLMVNLRPGMHKDRDQVIRELVGIQYSRNDYELRRGSFRVKGDVVDIYPSASDDIITRVSFFGEEIERITDIHAVSGKAITGRNYTAIFPASHYATTKDKMVRALVSIEKELDERLDELNRDGKMIEAYRLEQRTRYDLEMLRETGFCKGVENYSRHLADRSAGSPPFTLIDFFPKDFLLMIDESHVTVSQIGAMYSGDRSRKESLVNYGFRLPSAFDNRPLTFEEFEQKIGQMLFVSATPAAYEKEKSAAVVEQIIRPTGLVDPLIDIRPVDGQMDDILSEIRANTEKNERTLVLTLTKRMAEDLTAYLSNEEIRVRYLHSDIATVDRMHLLRELRQGRFDVLVGINLLREGLDLPEVSLLMILDADKEGFLRSARSLIQIIGRAARNVNGRVILYADRVTDAMFEAISETNRRRDLQLAYNEKHHITPQSIVKEVRDVLDTLEAISRDEAIEPTKLVGLLDNKTKQLSATERNRLIVRLEKEMAAAAGRLEFEEAARLRDIVIEIKGQRLEVVQKKGELS